MADLSTISATDPADAEVVSQGASRIRALCDAIKTSFGLGSGSGTQTAEHFLKGMHKFPAGDGTFPGLPGAPAAGNANRMFFDTTNPRVLRDNGAAWVMLHAAQFNSAYTAGSVSTGTSNSFATLITSPTVNIPTGGNTLVMACGSFTSVPGPVSTVLFRIRADGATVLEPGPTNSIQTTGGLATCYPFMISFDFSGAITAGAHVFTFEGTTPGATIYALARLAIVVLVI